MPNPCAYGAIVTSKFSAKLTGAAFNPTFMPLLTFIKLIRCGKVIAPCSVAKGEGVFGFRRSRRDFRFVAATAFSRFNPSFYVFRTILQIISVERVAPASIAAAEL